MLYSFLFSAAAAASWVSKHGPPQAPPTQAGCTNGPSPWSEISSFSVDRCKWNGLKCSWFLLSLQAIKWACGHENAAPWDCLTCLAHTAYTNPTSRPTHPPRSQPTNPVFVPTHPPQTPNPGFYLPGWWKGNASGWTTTPARVPGGGRAAAVEGQAVPTARAAATAADGRRRRGGDQRPADEAQGRSGIQASETEAKG